MAPSNVRIIVADDHEVVRNGLVSLLNGTDIEIVAEASTSEEVVSLACTHKPDVVLLDIRMAPGSGGLIALEKIRDEVPSVQCVMLTAFDNPTYIARAVAAGAHDYILKSCSRDELLDSIMNAASGQIPVRAGELRRVATTMSNRVATPDPDIPLTQRDASFASCGVGALQQGNCPISDNQCRNRKRACSKHPPKARCQ